MLNFEDPHADVFGKSMLGDLSLIIDAEEVQAIIGLDRTGSSASGGDVGAL